MAGGAFVLVAFFEESFPVGMNVLLDTMVVSVSLLAIMMRVHMFPCGFESKVRDR